MSKIDTALALGVRALSKPYAEIEDHLERVIWKSNKLDPVISVVHVFEINEQGEMLDWGWIEVRIRDGSFDFDGWINYQTDFGTATRYAVESQWALRSETFPDYE